MEGYTPSSIPSATPSATEAVFSDTSEQVIGTGCDGMGTTLSIVFFILVGFLGGIFFMMCWLTISARRVLGLAGFNVTVRKHMQKIIRLEEM